MDLLAEIGHELWVGDAAQIRASCVRQQMTDQRDAEHILKLLVEGRFPRIWMPSSEVRDLRQLLLHRHKLVTIRTRERMSCSICANPRFLRQQPRQRDLCGSCIPSSSNLVQKIHHRLVCLTRLLSDSRKYCSEVRAFKFGGGVNLPRQESLSKRTPGNKTDPQLLAGWQHLWFRVSRPNRILALNCCDRMDRVCAANGLAPASERPKCLTFAGLNQIFHCAGDILDGHIRINAVLIKEIDDVGLEALE